MIEARISQWHLESLSPCEQQSLRELVKQYSQRQGLDWEFSFYYAIFRDEDWFWLQLHQPRGIEYLKVAR